MIRSVIIVPNNDNNKTLLVDILISSKSIKILKNSVKFSLGSRKEACFLSGENVT